ncbi:4-amino-4-deoxy-L-arabinose transferase-like glycosyltransferase [Chitinophaga sp. W2I13]|uniref:ArnT family glycosyltransferase n=1 Tax=Chitinophaga sp. W2I13 TaxID=3373923 RepID=UPI003D252126
MIIRSSKPALWKGALIPLAYFILTFFIAQHHTLFEEWDGAMQYLAGVDLFEGKGYRGVSSHFWPPLFTLLTGLFTWIFQDGFAAAKFISVLSSSVLLLVIYRFVMKFTGSQVPAFLAQLLVAANPTYFLYSIQAQNVMLDTMFYVSAICFFFQALQSASYKYLFITGIMAGLAGLTRYTSYALLPSFIILLFFYYRPRAASSNVFTLFVGFAIVSLPWWIINTLNSGGPFNSWHYLNVGYGLSYQSAPVNPKWWWHDQASYNSVWQIMRQSPLDYGKHFLYNVMEVFSTLTIKTLLSFIGCIILFFIQFLSTRKCRSFLADNKFFLVIATCLIMYTGLISQAFIIDRLLLSWFAITGMAIAVLLYTIGMSDPGWIKLKPLVAGALLFFLLINVIVTIRKMDIYLDDKNDSGQLADMEKITQLLKAQDPDLSQKTIMAIHPASAYYLGCRFVMIPLYYDSNNINDWIAYGHLAPKVINYVPRFPGDLDITKSPVNYLIFNRLSSTYLPQFSFLLDEHTDKIPANFERLLLTKDVALYRITGIR